MHDIGAWDAPLRELVREIRQGILHIAEVGNDEWECVLMQGSGSFSVEAAVTSLTPRQGRLAIVANGAYGERMIKMATMAGIDVVPLRSPDNEAPTAETVEVKLASDTTIHTVAIVHCETTTGQLNDIESIGRVVSRAGRRYIVDAMSSFGAYPISLAKIGVDALISSSNKCIEGIPGFGFVLVRKEFVQQAASEGWPRSHSLDLCDQLAGFESGGKFRFTPPNQVLLAFRQALREFFMEGGLAARQARYQANHETLMRGMQEIGFKAFLPGSQMSYVITTFVCPSDPNFDFLEFYNRLSDQGLVIYPGKVSSASCFRIGSIGRIYPRDIKTLLLAIREIVHEMGFDPGLEAPPHGKSRQQVETTP